MKRKKLQLKKQVVANLTAQERFVVHGGTITTLPIFTKTDFNQSFVCFNTPDLTNPFTIGLEGESKEVCTHLFCTQNCTKVTCQDRTCNCA